MKTADMRVKVIAEAGVNHNGDLDMAIQLVDAAVEAGADAVKFQTFTADTIASKAAPKARYQLSTTDAAESQLDMLARLELSKEAHHRLRTHCRQHGIDFLSSPFDVESLDFLVNDLGLDTVKLASGEISNGPLLFDAARSGKNLILSTGMCDLCDVEEALDLIAFGLVNENTPQTREHYRGSRLSMQAGALLLQRVTLLQCTSEYPAPVEAINLRAMRPLGEAFGLPVGLSDHSQGIVVPIAAAALGATVIEKHFTLDKGLPGPDHKASIEPDELRDMVNGIRQVTTALGGSEKIANDRELETAAVVRKSLMTIEPIKKGELFSTKNLTVKRPGTGISPMRYWDVIGTSARRDYGADELLEEY